MEALAIILLGVGKIVRAAAPAFLFKRRKKILFRRFI
jgi:hypothetical protein